MECKSGPVLELQEVTKEYKIGKSTFRALDKVSLKICRGEFMSIMGPSGSGKSTLLHFLGFLDKPTSGDAFVEGKSMLSLNNDGLAEVRNRKIGFVFQSFNLAPTLSVFRNVELPMVIDGKPKGERRRKAGELLEAVGMAAKAGNLPSQLSGGERQRAAIARALANSPEIILADEPTGNLDSVSGKEVMKTLHSLWKKGLTVVIVTHEPVVASYANRTVHIRDGRVEKDIPRKGGDVPHEDADIKIKK
ncbi:MAG: ABC transporter ATP-binding protein [Candidatus Micrarchaeota archaeon]